MAKGYLLGLAGGQGLSLRVNWWPGAISGLTGGQQLMAVTELVNIAVS